jgi:hypothetical protein
MKTVTITLFVSALFLVEPVKSGQFEETISNAISLIGKQNSLNPRDGTVFYVDAKNAGGFVVFEQGGGCLYSASSNNTQSYEEVMVANVTYTASIFKSMRAKSPALTFQDLIKNRRNDGRYSVLSIEAASKEQFRQKALRFMYADMLSRASRLSKINDAFESGNKTIEKKVEVGNDGYLHVKFFGLENFINEAKELSEMGFVISQENYTIRELVIKDGAFNNKFTIREFAEIENILMPLKFSHVVEHVPSRTVNASEHECTISSKDSVEFGPEELQLKGYGLSEPDLEILPQKERPSRFWLWICAFTLTGGLVWYCFLRK